MADVKVKKKRSRLATPEPQAQGAGEHQEPEVLTPSIDKPVPLNKVAFTKWWSIISLSGFTYQIKKMTLKEAKQLAERRKGSIFNSHTSFTRAKKYINGEARIRAIAVFTELRRIRNLTKGDCE